MFPLIGSMISGASSLLGSWFSSDTSAKNTQAQIQAQQQAQAQSQAFNAEQAQINRDFQSTQAGVQRDYETTMSNTAYQRASSDMQKAGLNPMMMFGSGGPASTPGVSAPSGSQASTSTPTVPMPQNTSPFAGLGEMVSKAINTAISMKTMDKMTEEIANLKATQGLTVATEAQRRQETETEKQETTRRMNEAALSALRMPVARVSARQAEALEKMPDWLFNTVVQGGFTGGKVSDALSPLSDLISSARGVRSMLPSRSTRETTRTDTDGHGYSTFEEMWHNRFR